MLATSATGPHPFPSRTRQLSLSAPMVLRLRGRGRVGRRQPSTVKPTSDVPEAGFTFSAHRVSFQSMPSSTKFGTIVLAGRPNAGKSTLLNALIGQPLAIISPKPQSTRLPVTGLRTEGDTQIVFVDPPGLLEPSYALQRSMLDAALDALGSA